MKENVIIVFLLINLLFQLILTGNISLNDKFKQIQVTFIEILIQKTYKNLNLAGLELALPE